MQGKLCQCARPAGLAEFCCATIGGFTDPFFVLWVIQLVYLSDKQKGTEEYYE
jgi:hypothetical protein